MQGGRNMKSKCWLRFTLPRWMPQNILVRAAKNVQNSATDTRQEMYWSMPLENVPGCETD